MFRTKLKQLGAATAIALIVITSLSTSCGSSQANFCRSANDLQNTVEKLELKDFTAALGPEFWIAVQKTVDDIVLSSSGEFKDTIKDLQTELDLLIDRLESVDYDLALLALSPDSAADLTAFASILVAFVAVELQAEIDSNCGY